jgi:hypothetical protein
MGTGLFPEVKQSTSGVDHPHHLAARLKKEKSYTSAAPSVLSWLAVGCNLPVPLPDTFSTASVWPRLTVYLQDTELAQSLSLDPTQVLKFT